MEPSGRARGIATSMRRALLALALVVVGMLAVSGLAPAKEDARARLLSAVPIGAAPGTTVHVRWLVTVPDDSGRRQPGPGGFVRLLSRTGAPSTTAYPHAPSSPGRFSADVTVPDGGIGGIRIGLAGRACAATCRRADAIFPIENNPFTSPGGVTCDVGLLRMTLTRYVRAYNRGDLAALDRLFSRGHFVWYSSGAPGPRVGNDAANRDSLIAYFGRRHRHGDRLRLLTFRFNSYDRQRDLGHFELTAQRRAADFRSGSWFDLSGKGALDCSTPPATIAVLSLGGAAS